MNRQIVCRLARSRLLKIAAIRERARCVSRRYGDLAGGGGGGAAGGGGIGGFGIHTQW